MRVHLRSWLSWLCLVLLCGCTAGQARSPGPSVVPISSSASSQPGANRDLTLILLRQLLNSMPVVPGSTEDTASPTPLLASVQQIPDSPGLETVSRWWSVPDASADPLQYIGAHVKGPLRQNGGGYGSSPQGSTRSIFFERPDTAYAVEIRVIVTTATVGQSTAVRIDAEGIYLPPRPDLDLLVPNPSSVAVTIERSGHPTVRRVLGREAATLFVRVLRSLPVAAPGVRSCPAFSGTQQDVLTFATSRGPVVVTDWLTGCAGIGISDDPGVGLGGAGTLDQAVLKAIGSPVGPVRHL